MTMLSLTWDTGLTWLSVSVIFPKLNIFFNVLYVESNVTKALKDLLETVTRHGKGETHAGSK
jgi:hypothetical protein